MEDGTNIGQRIYDLRVERDIAQGTLADAVHLHQSVLNRIEKGTRPARDREVRDIALYFGVSADELLGMPPRAADDAHLSPLERHLLEKFRFLLLLALLAARPAARPLPATPLAGLPPLAPMPGAPMPGGLEAAVRGYPPPPPRRPLVIPPHAPFRRPARHPFSADARCTPSRGRRRGRRVRRASSSSRV